MIQALTELLTRFLIILGFGLGILAASFILVFFFMLMQKAHRAFNNRSRIAAFWLSLIVFFTGVGVADAIFLAYLYLLFNKPA